MSARAGRAGGPRCSLTLVLCYRSLGSAIYQAVRQAGTLPVHLPLGNAPGTTSGFPNSWATVGKSDLTTTWFVDFDRRTEEHFTGVHQSFAQRRMRVNRFGQVSHFASHLDRQDGFGDQLAGPGPTMPQPRTRLLSGSTIHLVRPSTRPNAWARPLAAHG